jgi:hypothetical protein
VGEDDIPVLFGEVEFHPGLGGFRGERDIPEIENQHAVPVGAHGIGFSQEVFHLTGELWIGGGIGFAAQDAFNGDIGITDGFVPQVPHIPQVAIVWLGFQVPDLVTGSVTGPPAAVLDVSIPGHVVGQPGTETVMAEMDIHGIHGLAGIFSIGEDILAVESGERFRIQEILAGRKHQQGQQGYY